MGRRDLARRIGPLRPTEGRLVGVAYAPYGAPVVKTKEGLPGLTRRAERALRAAPYSADRLAAKALLQVIAGDFEGAAGALEEAAEHDPAPAPWLSDLAAIHLQRAETQHRAYEIVLALIAAEAAWKRDRRLLPAGFNRALVKEKLSLRHAALAAWEDYLAKERDPSWQAEARAHVQRLNRPPTTLLWAEKRQILSQAAWRGEMEGVLSIVRRFPQEAREAVEGEVLPEWALAREAGRLTAAERSLGLARAVGAALVATTGESLIWETVAALDAASTGVPGVRLSELIAGHRKCGEGLTQYKAGAFGRAARSLAEAHRALSAAGSPFAEWASFQLARCAYQRHAYAEVMRRLRALLERQERAPHLALKASALNLLGLAEILADDPMASMTTYAEAIHTFSAAGEPGNRALAQSGLATDLDILGEVEGVWDPLLPALGTAMEVGEPRAVYAAFEQAALSALRLGQTELAADFQDEVVTAAEQAGRAFMLAEALRGRALIREAAGDRKQALGDLTRAAEQARTLLDPATQRIVLGDLTRVQGEIEGTVDPRQAVLSFSRAIAVYRQTEYPYLTARVLLERGLALHALGRQEDAARDFDAAMAERERQRGQISDAWRRISYFDDLQEIFETMVRFQVDTQQRPDLALDAVERGRARLLLDFLLATPKPGTSPLPSSGAARPLTSSQVRDALPARTAVVEYFLLSDRLLAWVLAPGKLHFSALACDRALLGQLVARLNEAFAARRESAAMDLAGNLYDLLIRPLSRDLPAGWNLVIVPDGALGALPFSALRARESGRFLVQDHPLAMAPSASVWVASRGRDQLLRASGWTRALAVDDPAFDRAMFPQLPSLHFAGSAVGQWIDQHPGSAVFAHERASRADFLRFAGDYPIVHFSGHALVNRDAPLRSRLLFAAVSGQPDAGVLYAGDLLGRSFPRTRLVILAGCATAAGRVSRREGTLGLTLPFLAAGVPAVIGSLWNVDDRETELLFAAFYRLLGKGASPIAALQGAQLERLADELSNHGDPGAGAWAAFELTGSSS
jgi:CHAT domain-containing protein/tetratricopeptide (TPR) repeat protein